MENFPYMLRAIYHLLLMIFYRPGVFKCLQEINEPILIKTLNYIVSLFHLPRQTVYQISVMFLYSSVTIIEP